MGPAWRQSRGMSSFTTAFAQPPISCCLFTSKGNYLYIPVNEIKETKWNDEGFHVNQLVSIAPDEKAGSGFRGQPFPRRSLLVVLFSKKGFIKRIASFELPRRSAEQSLSRHQTRQ
jgi:DNA gyrase/topoisomerase IV subunit A